MNDHLLDGAKVKRFMNVNAALLIKNDAMDARLAQMYNEFASACKVTPLFTDVDVRKGEWTWTLDT